MDISAIRSQDTKAWPGKISLVVVAGKGGHSMREVESELQKGFTTDAVVFEGDVESQSDLPIAAKKAKLRNKLVRVNTNGTNPRLVKTLIERRLADYISLEAGSEEALDSARESVVLVEKSGVPHEIVLDCRKLDENEIRRAASSVTGTLVLRGDSPGLGEIAGRVSGPGHVRVRSGGREQSIS